MSFLLLLLLATITFNIIVINTLSYYYYCPKYIFLFYCADSSILIFYKICINIRRNEQENKMIKNGLRLGDVTSLNITILEAGKQHNVIPSIATAGIDIRCVLFSVFSMFKNLSWSIQGLFHTDSYGNSKSANNNSHRKNTKESFILHQLLVQQKYYQWWWY